MADLESLRDIPGFKAILQSVLKSQIQLLLEQLSQNTGEESFILTASVNDGTLSHLGSKTGKGFLAGKQEIKSQFLGYCMKTHHKPATPDVPQSFQSGQPHSPLLQPYTDGMKKPRSSTPKGQPRASPYARPFSEKARRQSYQDTSDASFQNPVTSQSDSEGQDHTHSRDSTIVVKQESGDSVTVARGDTLTMPTDGGRPNVPSYPSPSVPFPSSLGLSHTQTSSEQTNAESNSRSDRNSESDQNESSTNNDAGEGGEFNSSVKIEPITENEMELEITGVEMADGSLSSDQWGQLAYAEGDNSYMNQGADQLQYRADLTFSATTGSYTTSNLTPASTSLRKLTHLSVSDTGPEYDGGKELPTGAIYKPFESQSSSRGNRTDASKGNLGSSRLACEYCSRVLANRESKRKHMMIHTGARPFFCEICGKDFRQKHHKNTHMRTIHGSGKHS